MEEMFFCPSCMAKTAPEEGQCDVSDWSHIKLP